MAKSDYLLAAAIDVGTTYSGFAYSFRHEFERDPIKVSSKTWTPGSGNLMSLKTSTCILFDKDGKFYSFGFEAEDKYVDLALDGEENNWYYFRHFKMALYDKMVIHPWNSEPLFQYCLGSFKSWTFYD